MKDLIQRLEEASKLVTITDGDGYTRKVDPNSIRWVPEVLNQDRPDKMKPSAVKVKARDLAKGGKRFGEENWSEEWEAIRSAKDWIKYNSED